MSDATMHVIKSYEQELQQLRSLVVEMGGMVEAQVAQATDAVVNRDVAAAARAVEADPKVDALEHDLERFAIRLLALRQPVADDLRLIIAALKASDDLERIGDYAAGVAKRAIVLAEHPATFNLAGLAHMAELVRQNLHKMIIALSDANAEAAAEVWRADKSVDDMYNIVFREFMTYMLEDLRNMTPCTHLLFIARSLERVGDHATNVAETMYYAATGEELSGPRPKSEQLVPAADTGSSG
jgi:phosphate transport system protein